MKEKLFTRIKKEIQTQTSRSSGPGGQHANKVETRVTIKFNVRESEILTDYERNVLLSKLGNKLNKEGELLISCEDSRSQLKNKEQAFKKFERLLVRVFFVPKKRKPTKPTKSSVHKRLDSKKKHAEKKRMRGRID